MGIESAPTYSAMLSAHTVARQSKADRFDQVLGYGDRESLGSRPDQRPLTENASSTLTSFAPVLAAPIRPDIV